MTRPALLAYAEAIVALLIASAIGAHGPGTWAMEVAPVFIALPLMLATHLRFAADYTLFIPRSVARHVSVPGSEFVIATALTRTMVLRG